MKILNFVLILIIMENLAICQINNQTNVDPQATTPGTGGNNGANVECTSNDLEIEQFDSHKKVNKIVVSGPNAKELFDYKGISKVDENLIQSLTWKLGDGMFKDFWHITSDQPWRLNGKAYIPENALPASNDDFGKKHGNIEVELVTTSGSNKYYGLSQTPQPVEISVFFRKDDEIFTEDGKKGTNLKNVPNWFYFWSSITEVKNVLSCPGIKLYDPVLGKFNDSRTPFTYKLTYRDKNGFGWPPYSYFNENGDRVVTTKYGANNFYDFTSSATLFQKHIINSKEDFVISGYPISPNILEIVIGKGCGYYFHDKHNKSDPEGIEVFCEALYHELEHGIITMENWENGYSTLLDTDLDNYRDSWELEHAGFTVGVNDSYLYYDSKKKKKGFGFFYEEGRCRNEQTKHTTKLNSNDWSFDPDRKIQGKNWK